MGDVAGVVLASAVAMLAASLVAAGLLVRDAFAGRASAESAAAAERDARAKAERDRDDSAARAAQAALERDEARRYAAVLTRSLDAARGELTKYVREKLAAGSDADVAAELDRLLGVPVPAVRPGAQAAGAGVGAAGPGAVPGT